MTSASSLLPDWEPRYFPAVPRLLRCDYVAQFSLAQIAVRYGELLEDDLLLLFCALSSLIYFRRLKSPRLRRTNKHAWTRRPTLLSPDVPGVEDGVKRGREDEETLHVLNLRNVPGAQVPGERSSRSEHGIHVND